MFYLLIKIKTLFIFLNSIMEIQLIPPFPNTILNLLIKLKKILFINIIIKKYY